VTTVVTLSNASQTIRRHETVSGSVKHPRKNKPTFQRYWNEDHLLENRTKRIMKNDAKNAGKLCAEWKKRYEVLKKRKA